MYYLVIVFIAITAINTVWTLLDHKGMSVVKIIISCFLRIQFVSLVLFIVYFDIDLSVPMKIAEKIFSISKR